MTTFRNIRNLPKEWYLSVLIFAMFFAWTMAFPFEGLVIKRVIAGTSMGTNVFMYSGLISIFLGLLLNHHFIKKMSHARAAMKISLVFCIICTCTYFSSIPLVWLHATIVGGLFSGIFVSSFGYYFQYVYSRPNRYKASSESLIVAGVLVTSLNILSLTLSMKAGLLFSVIYLLIALFLSMGMPVYEELPGKELNTLSLAPFFSRSVAVLAIVASVLTICCGFVSTLIPDITGADHMPLYILYTLAYILPLITVRFYRKKIIFVMMLYFIAFFTGFIFLSLLYFKSHPVGLVLMNLFMPISIALLNLFWSTVIGDLLEYHQNPAKIMGIGLAMYLSSIIAGEFLGFTAISFHASITTTAILSLGVLLTVFLVLPMIRNSVDNIQHAHEEKVDILTENLQKQSINEFLKNSSLTSREADTATLLLLGYTYKMIASELHVSENTVRTHIKKIYQKYEVQSRMELLNVMFASIEHNPVIRK